MKKLIFSFLLMSVSLTVFAEWTYVTTSVKDDKWYVDFSTKKVNNGTVKIWVRNIFNQISKNGDYGVSGQMEFDCNNDLLRDVYLVYYSDVELKNVSFVDSELSKWNPIVPNSTLETVFKTVCQK